MIILNSFKKYIALIVCFYCKLIYFRKLDIRMPSLSFSFFPFHLYQNSKTLIGKKAIISRHCKIISKGIITIGDNFFINEFSRIVAFENIIIGNNVTIAQFVTILDHDHDYNLVDGNLILNGYNTKAIVIGDNVWIGDKVTICKGVTVGNNVIIGANSVVTKNIPSNQIVAGSPVKLLKEISG